jgi:Icc-related predicted phosphoesterase
MMRVYAASDLHGFYPDIPDCELLLLGGDYSPSRDEHRAKEFFKGEFSDWLKQVPAKYIVGIAGNHDYTLLDREFAKSLPWIYLQDELLDLEGVRIWGTPWTPVFGDWAFMEPENRLAHRFGKIPDKLDILLTHGPAHSVLDKTVGGTRAGSKMLYSIIKQVNPDSVVCGHIHEAHGIEQIADTRFYNVAHVTEYMQPKYDPVNIPLRAA